MPMNQKTFIAAVILFTLLFTTVAQTCTVQPAKAAPADTTAKGKIPVFLSDVMGIDVSKFKMTNISLSF